MATAPRGHGPKMCEPLPLARPLQRRLPVLQLLAAKDAGLAAAAPLGLSGPFRLGLLRQLRRSTEPMPECQRKTPCTSPRRRGPQLWLAAFFAAPFCGVGPRVGVRGDVSTRSVVGIHEETNMLKCRCAQSALRHTRRSRLRKQVKISPRV